MGVNTEIGSSVVELLDFYSQNKIENRANIEEMETHSAKFLKSSETIPLLYGLHVWNSASYLFIGKKREVKLSRTEKETR